MVALLSRNPQSGGVDAHSSGGGRPGCSIAALQGGRFTRRAGKLPGGARATERRRKNSFCRVVAVRWTGRKGGSSTSDCGNAHRKRSPRNGRNRESAAIPDYKHSKWRDRVSRALLLRPGSIRFVRGFRVGA